MLNYVKSEFYRILHSKDIYCFTVILAGLAFLSNVVLYGFGKMDGESFRYNMTSFSYSNLVAAPMVFCVMGAGVGFVLYEGNRKNGNLKNTIAFGISRLQVFAGECIVAGITAVLSCLVILAAFIVSAVLLLEQTGPVGLMDLLTEILAIFFMAIACLISAIVCLEAFGKESVGILVWAVVWYFVPTLLFYLGLRFDILYRIAMWMPANYFGTNGMVVNMSQCITAWGTVEGMAKCVLSGIIGILVFALSGVVLLRKKEL